MSKSCSFLHFNRCVTKVINPDQSYNYKLNANTNTNFANISRQMRISQRLKLDSSSQRSKPIGRINGGITQFGNFYLGQQLSVNYLGRMEGQPGGSGSAPKNQF